jgi:hypothetical protein
VLWIRIRIGLVSGVLIKGGKNDPKEKKKVKISFFEVLDVFL